MTAPALAYCITYSPSALLTLAFSTAVILACSRLVIVVPRPQAVPEATLQCNAGSPASSNLSPHCRASVHTHFRLLSRSPGTDTNPHPVPGCLICRPANSTLIKTGGSVGRWPRGVHRHRVGQLDTVFLHIHEAEWRFSIAVMYLGVGREVAEALKTFQIQGRL